MKILIAYAEQYRKVEFEHAQEAQKAAAVLLRSAGFIVEEMIKESQAIDLLIAETERWNADVIFLGAPSRRQCFTGSGSKSTLLGRDNSLTVYHWPQRD